MSARPSKVWCVWVFLPHKYAPLGHSRPVSARPKIDCPGCLNQTSCPQVVGPDAMGTSLRLEHGATHLICNCRRRGKRRKPLAEAPRPLTFSYSGGPTPSASMDAAAGVGSAPDPVTIQPGFARSCTSVDFRCAPYTQCRIDPRGGHKSSNHPTQ